jgi:predicted DNA-binding transcriptional regulator AlpA
VTEVTQPDRLLDKRAACETLALSRASFDKRRRLDDRFPQPVKIGSILRWRQSEIQGYIQQLGKEVDRDT